MKNGKEKVLEEYEDLKNEIQMTKKAVQETAKNIKKDIDEWMGEDITEVTSGRRKVEQVDAYDYTPPKKKNLSTRIKNLFRKKEKSGTGS